MSLLDLGKGAHSIFATLAEESCIAGIVRIAVQYLGHSLLVLIGLIISADLVLELLPGNGSLSQYVSALANDRAQLLSSRANGLAKVGSQSNECSDRPMEPVVRALHCCMADKEDRQP
jgi:hypothetical protein